MTVLKAILCIFFISSVVESKTASTTPPPLWPQIKDRILGAPLMIGAESMSAICANEVKGFCSHGTEIPLYVTFVGRALTEYFRKNSPITQAFFSETLPKQRSDRLNEIFRYYRDIDNTENLTIQDKLAVLRMFLDHLEQPVLSDQVHAAMTKNSDCQTNVGEVWDEIDKLPAPNRNSFFFLVNALQYAMNKSIVQTNGKQQIQLPATSLAKELDFYHKNSGSGRIELKQAYYTCLAHLIQTYEPVGTSNLYEYGNRGKKTSQLRAH